MGVIGQGFNLWLIADKWPRVRTMGMWKVPHNELEAYQRTESGSLILAVMLSLLMALSKFYGKDKISLVHPQE